MRTTLQSAKSQLNKGESASIPFATRERDSPAPGSELVRDWFALELDLVVEDCGDCQVSTRVRPQKQGITHASGPGCSAGATPRRSSCWCGRESFARACTSRLARGLRTSRQSEKSKGSVVVGRRERRSRRTCSTERAPGWSSTSCTGAATLFVKTDAGRRITAPLIESERWKMSCQRDASRREELERTEGLMTSSQGDVSEK